MAKRMFIPLGSGFMYYTEYSGEIPDDTTIETADNRLGYIEGGAEISYKPTTKTLTDDFGIVSREVITAEEASLKASMIAWNSKDLPVFVNTARVTEKKSGDKTIRTIKIGGLQNDSGKIYVFRFVHPDSQYGDVRVTLIGRSSAEIKLSYKKDDASNLDLEVAAQSQDDEGTLILYDEDITGEASASA